MNVNDFVVPQLHGMRGYIPTPTAGQMAQKLGLPLSAMIKLDANENVMPPSRVVLDAMASTPPNLYPDPDQNLLRDALSNYLGVDRKHILCANGGDEILHLIFRIFVGPGDGVIDCPPTFGVYAHEAAQAHANYVAVPRRADFSIDVDAVEAAVRNTPRAKVLFVTNPNNPDGSVTSPADLSRLMALPIMVVVDEAYIELSSQPNVVQHAVASDNVIVVRTLSKLVGLAGMRVGYGVFPANIVGFVWGVKPYFAPSAPSQHVAVAALSDRAHIDATKRAIVAERNRLCETLDELGWLTPVPSETNFVLCKVTHPGMGGQPKPAGALLHGALEQRGILTRFFGGVLGDYVRISIGRPDQMDALVAALKDIGAHGTNLTPQPAI